MSAAASSSSSGEAAAASSDARSMALRARSASRTLKSLGYVTRQAVLRAIADALASPTNLPAILAANEADVRAAREEGKLSSSSLARLELSESKLRTLAAGLRQLSDPAYIPDPVNRLLKQTLVAEGLVLQQRSVPLGVLLVIFESRPDVLPQLVGLSVLSSNGLLLKGGRESTHTLRLLHQLCVDAISAASGGAVAGSELISLISGREAVGELLQLDDCIDLVIPRGGNDLVSYVKSHTRIPVLGHADGVCHAYLDRDFGGVDNLPNMIRLIIDCKADYPAACNAVETLLMHRELVTAQGLEGDSSAAHSVVRSLRESGISLLLGPAAAAHAAAQADSSPFHSLPAAESLHTEYGDLRLCVELVDGLAAAVEHIHQWGSGHTELVLTADSSVAARFLDSVDSACVFHNASTRFADGFRMGLGAEVGISTSRIHARGPVGVEGLCTTKWTLQAKAKEGQPVQPFHKGQQTYLHKQLDVSEDKL